MKTRFISGLLYVGLSVSMISAQEDVSSTAAGSKALLFSFNGLSTLGAGAYNGGIGGKYFLNDQLAVRGGVKFSTLHQKVLTAALTGGEDGSNSATEMGLFAGGEYHLSMNRLSPYVGAGLGFSMVSTKQVQPVNASTAPKVTIENGVIQGWNYFPGTNFDIGALAGAEFFITKEISLSAEYLLGYELVSLATVKTITETGNEKKTDEKKQGGIWNLGISNGGSLTLAVYF